MIDTAHPLDVVRRRGIRISDRQRSMLLLLVVFAVAALVRWLFLNGPAGSDDTRYMDAAVALANGDPPARLDHANVRASFLIWLASWSLLGFSASQLVLSQIAASALQAGALFWVARMLTDNRSAVIAAVLWIFFPVELVYGGVLTPDQISVAFGLVSLGFVVRGLREPNSPSIQNALVAGVFAALAYSAKEPFFLLTAVLGGWSAVRIGLGRRTWRWHASLIAGFLVVIILEHVFYAMWTGDWLYKYHALLGAYGPGGAGRMPVSLGALIYYPRDVLANFATSGFFGWLVVVGALASVGHVRCRGLVLIWSAVFFAFLQFGSSGIREYSLLPMQPRYVGPIVILLFIPLGLTVLRLARESPLRRTGTVILFSVFAYHATLVARERMSLGLYYSDLPASAIALISDAPSERRELLVPMNFHRQLPDDLRGATGSWREVEFEELARAGSPLLESTCRCAVLVPKMMSTGELRNRLEEAGFLERPVVAPVTPLDALLHHAPLSLMNARAQQRVVAHIYERAGATTQTRSAVSHSPGLPHSPWHRDRDS